MSRKQQRLERIKRLYVAMPGARMPPTEDGFYLWGEVAGTPEWNFCEAIVDMMDREIGCAISSLASEHNLV